MIASLALVALLAVPAFVILDGNTAHPSSSEPVDLDTNPAPDGLSPAAKERAETEDGVELPDATPGQLDLYVQLHYSSGVDPLSDQELRDLKGIWADMSVANPDGSTGINLHVTREKRLDERLETDMLRGAFFTDLKNEYYTAENMEGRDCTDRLVVFVHDNRGYSSGVGDAPGYLSAVDGSETDVYSGTTGRVETVTHELLHNVVGTIDHPDAHSDGAHTDDGWLAKPRRDYSPKLSNITSSKLNRTGFSRPDSDTLYAC